MKRSNFFMLVCVAVLSLFTFSCETVKGLLGETPSASIEAVQLKSLDFEGITFVCDYAITNHYPVGISIKEIATDILCDGKTFTKLNTDGGLKIDAKGTHSNKLNFTIPYTAILDFAKTVVQKDALPFSLNGSISLDLSFVQGIGMDEMKIPFSKNFNVPIFKPEFSFGGASVKLPTVKELTDALLKGGVNVIKAAQLANSIVSKQKITADIFDGIDLNLDFICNLNVKNGGSSAWNFVLNTCSVKTSSGSLISLSPVGTNKIDSASGTIPLKASLNTVQFGFFIAQLINKSGTNPTFVFESSLSFPKLNYAPNLPLSYSQEIPLSKISVN